MHGSSPQQGPAPLSDPAESAQHTTTESVRATEPGPDGATVFSPRTQEQIDALMPEIAERYHPWAPLPGEDRDTPPSTPLRKLDALLENRRVEKSRIAAPTAESAQQATAAEPIRESTESAQQATAAAPIRESAVPPRERYIYIPFKWSDGAPEWTCPACTLYRQARCITCSAPFCPGNPEWGTGHLSCKEHLIALKNVQAYLLTREGMAEYFSYIADEPQPDLDRISPAQALKNYTAANGGDPERTINHFTLVVPELCGPMTLDHLALLGLELPHG